MGDAAHAPSPRMAGGAALAIEDGVVLAEELVRRQDIRKALKAFVDRRRERSSRSSGIVPRIRSSRQVTGGWRDRHGARLGGNR
ncbi:hypothetical protein [Amycolatopsis lurida]|uniref:hypothetical protein n=1 Tax=Amycolatopsis lurida TaxID=31959 RepID=UPI0018E9A518|nr:hypothetical protein [Amycolatopsis lurida]